MSQEFFNSLAGLDSAIKSTKTNLDAGWVQHKGGQRRQAPDYAAREAAYNRAVQAKKDYISNYTQSAAKNPDPYMGEGFTPTDWGKKTADYNSQIDALKKQGMRWIDWAQSTRNSVRGLRDPYGWRLNDGVQAQIDELTRQRDNLPTLIEAEKSGIGAAQVVKQRNADIRAEDIQIQERAQQKNMLARQGLGKLNQINAEADKQIAARNAGLTSSLGKNTGGAFDLGKQRQSAQQSVGAAMSAAPGVSAFAGKAASVAPTNLVAQTANTGALKNMQNKNQGINTAVASRAANVAASSNFKLPDIAGVQIGEGKIQQFGGS